MTRPTLLLAAAMLLLSFGCSRPSYINVPNDAADVAINGPNWKTTVELEKKALAYMLRQSSIPGDVVIRLPQGTKESVAFEIANSLSEFNVFPEGQSPSDEFQLVEVRKITARGGIGRVDIIRPGTLRERELVEVHVKWDVLDGWVLDYIRPRNIDVDRIDPLLLAAPAAEPKKPAYEEVEPEDAPAQTPGE